MTPDEKADWKYIYQERAAIMEYDGKLPRKVAEREAQALVRAEMERWKKRKEDGDDRHVAS
jgi:hypothetical protein